MALPGILERERCKVGGKERNVLQNIVLQAFCPIFRLEGGILSEKGKMGEGGACMFQGQIGNITPQNPGKSDNFPV